MQIPYKNIPTYNHQTGVWSKISFPSQFDFSNYLDSLFKEPGNYEFDETTKMWNEQARRFDKKGYYTEATYGSNEYNDYWNEEKEKCRKGVIWINGDKQWYVERAYYMLLNFLPVINKEKGNIKTFPDVRDVQYHLSLYEKRAEAQNKHSIGTKKRQMLASYYHTAKMLNVYWFERDAILKNLASSETYLTGENGIWNYYNGYRDFLNEFTAWVRPNTPNQDLSWKQQIEQVVDGRKRYTGRKSVLTGKSVGMKATAGVGGPAWYVYHEEPGVAPKMDKTYIFMKSNLQSGINTTGMFFGAGSVGELKDCEPLKKFMESPEEYGFLGVENTWFDVDRTPKLTGLYIPEQWGMPGFIDEFGNSKVQEALDYLNKTYDELEKSVDAQDYQYEVSQHPRYQKEAFAYREISKYPVRLIERKQQELKDLEKSNPTSKKLPKKVILEEDSEGKITFKHSEKLDISYPVDKNADDKSGVVLMHIPPDPKYKHYGGVDTIEVGITKTSDSLFSIYIVRGNAEVEHVEADEETGEIKKYITLEGIKLAASWTGRLGEVPETNDQAIMLMKLYGARSAVERNKPNFINECQKRGIAAKYLLKEKELPFTKDLDFSKNFTGDDYGVYMDSTNKKQNDLDGYTIEYLKEEKDALFKKDPDGMYTSETKRIYRGIDEINDYWLLEELKQPDSANTDRKRAFGLAITAAKTFEIQGIKTRIREESSFKEKKISTKKRPIILLGKEKRLIRF